MFQNLTSSQSCEPNTAYQGHRWWL